MFSVRRTRILRTGLVAAILMAPSISYAAGSVSWLAPPNNSTFQVGTVVSPDGIANASGTTGGQGLDLSLVLDSSGSMSIGVDLDPGQPGFETTRQQLQQDAALALVAALPDIARVAVTDFDSSATLLQGLTTLNSSGRNAVNAAIQSIDAIGLTDIGDGIVNGTDELNANGDPNAIARMLVVSDGESNQALAENAASAANADGIVVDTVGFPGGSTSVLEAVADAGGGTFFNFTGNPNDIISAFSGAGGGTPVDIQSITVTDPAGSSYSVGAGILGNFNAVGYALELGNNVFTVEALFTDGSSDSATLNLIGANNPAQVVPLPASALLLVGAMGGLGIMRRRRRG